jgi:hypothetical protein
MRYTPNFSKFNSLFELISYFNSEKKCERFIAVNRWNTQVNDEGERFTTMLSNAIGLCTYEQVKMVA